MKSGTVEESGKKNKKGEKGKAGHIHADAQARRQTDKPKTRRHVYTQTRKHHLVITLLDSALEVPIRIETSTSLDLY